MDAKAPLDASPTIENPHYTFALEELCAVWSEAEPLFYANQRETGQFPSDDFKLPKDLYFKIEELGKLRFYSMRCNGKLVGYQVFSLEPHPRYEHVELAIPIREMAQDVIFVLPVHRGVSVLRFFEYANKAIELEGCKPIRHNTMKHDHSRLLAHMGFRKIEETWIRE